MFHIQSSRFLSVGNFPLIGMEARLDPELYRTFAFFILVIAQSSSVSLRANKQPWECGDETELMPGKTGTVIHDYHYYNTQPAKLPVISDSLLFPSKGKYLLKYSGRENRQVSQAS